MELCADELLLKELTDSFVANTSSCKEHLTFMFREHPKYVRIEKTDGVLELSFERKRLIEKLRESRPKLDFISFERGLKHTGMKVTQTTHGNTWKKWRIRCEPPPTKKTKKRDVGTEDDSYLGVLSTRCSPVKTRKRAKLAVDTPFQVVAPPPAIVVDMSNFDWKFTTIPCGWEPIDFFAIE